MSVDKPWWHPQNLKESERTQREQLDPNTDFGSYRLALLGKSPETSMINEHNDIRPDRRVRWIAKTLGLRGNHKILDAGCGLGFTSAALKRYGSSTNLR